MEGSVRWSGCGLGLTVVVSTAVITQANVSLLHVFKVQIGLCPNSFFSCAQTCYDSSCTPSRRSHVHEPGLLGGTVDNMQKWVAEVPGPSTECTTVP